MKSIDILVPAFNEAECLPRLHAELCRVLADQPYAWRLIIIDDGSTDATPLVCARLREQDPRVGSIRFSRNFGHQAALTAGLDACDGACAITMDADLQHPPAMLPALLQAWENGAELVTGVRREGAKLGLGKKLSSRLFYGLLRRLTDVPVAANAPDFRLLDQKVVRAVRRLREQGRFLRGIYSWVGFREVQLAYDQAERHAGTSKYDALKMIRFAVSAVLSFSRAPLRFAIYLGLLVSALSFAYGVYALIVHLVLHETVQGWTSLAVLLSFLSGIQLLTLGVFGEYLGQVLDESKRRPLYVVSEVALPLPREDDGERSTEER